MLHGITGFEWHINGVSLRYDIRICCNKMDLDNSPRLIHCLQPLAFEYQGYRIRITQFQRI